MGASPPRRPAPPCAGSAFDPATGELTADDVAEVLTDAHEAGRGHRRLQPDRHPAAGRRDRRAGARGRRAAGRRRRAPHRARAGRRRRAGRRLLHLLAVQVPRPALRRAGRGAGAAGDAARRPSCCRRPTPSPSGSSSAPCPTSCWPGRRRPSTSSPGSRPAGGTRRERLVAAMTALEEYEDELREHLEAGLRGAARRPAVVAGRAPDADAAAHLRRARDAADAYRFLAERGVNAPAGLVLRDRGQPLARPRRRRRPAGRARALQRPGRRRPPARRPAGVPRRPLTAMTGRRRAPSRPAAADGGPPGAPCRASGSRS